MIKHIDITGHKVEVSEDLNKYIIKKVSKLDRYMPRHARKSVHAEVKMTETTASKNKSSNKYECEVILHLPGEQMTAKESTLNMFAAVDIVETKLKNQLRKYKEKAIKGPRVDRQTLFSKLRSFYRKK